MFLNPKICPAVIISIILTLGIFMSFQYLFAWTNPALNPPSGNVSPAINEGSTAQVKDGSLGISGNLTASIFYDSDNVDYYINPAGTSKFNSVNLGGDSRSSWPSVPADGLNISSYSPGNNVVASAPAERSHIYNYYVKMKEIKIDRGGVLRIGWCQSASNSTGVRGRVYRNGSPVGTEYSSTQGEVCPQEDISGWLPGDLVQLYIRDNSWGTTARCRNFTIKAANTYQLQINLD